MTPLFRPLRVGCVCLFTLPGLIARGDDTPGAPAPAARNQAPSATSSPTPAAPAARAPNNGELQKIQGIFDTDLPKTENKGSIRLIVHPHVGDFINRSYVRVLTGIRWGLNDHTEFTAAVEPYFDMSTKSGPSGNGIGDYQLGVKYGFREKLFPGYDTSVGLNTYFPVGHPPVDLTTGHDRYSPYIVIGKKIPSRPGLTVFLNAGPNILHKTSIPGQFEDNVPHSSSFAITPGLVYGHYPYHYTLEFTCETTSLLGHGNKQFFTLRPGFAWDLPPKFKFHAKGRWTIGVGFHVTVGPEGTTTGAGGKLRVDLGISRWFHRNTPAPDTGDSH
jgi:hypothetical protein